MLNKHRPVKHSQFSEPCDFQLDHASIVVMGIRPLVILGLSDGAEDEVAHIRNMMADVAERVSDDQNSAIPFAIPYGKTGAYPFGVASEQWIVDLLEWAFAYAPERQRNQIACLLAGHSVQAIAQLDRDTSQVCATLPNARVDYLGIGGKTELSLPS